MKKLFILLLTLFLLLSVSGCNNNKQEEITQNINHIDSDLVNDYVHYDDTKFYEMIEEVKPLIIDGDNKAIDLYDKLFVEAKLVYDYLVMSMVNYDVDYTNEYWSNEYQYSDMLNNTIKDAFLTIAHELSESSIKDEFKKHVNNEELFNYYVDYVPLSVEMLELLNSESELVNEYTNLDYEADDYYELAGEIFMELLVVRAKLAKGYGYDNYIEYTDTGLYSRDYDFKELANFYKAAKDMKFEEVDALNDKLIENKPEYNVDGQTSLIDLKRTIEGVSTYVDEAYNYLDTHNLHWYDNSLLNSQTGYTLMFLSNNTPYIFNNLVGNPYDLYYQVHELGHFANYLLTPNDYQIVSDGNYDLLEIHSQALELLCIDNVNEILGIEDNLYRFKELKAAIATVIDGCLYDEWQRLVYSNPTMSLEEVDNLFNELAYEYGFNENKEDVSDMWRDVIHNFTDPGYYISYATSMYAAIQLYNTSKVNRALAIEQYNEILKLDSIKYGYKYAIENAGMVMFNDYDQTLTILNNACDEIINSVNKNN